MNESSVSSPFMSQLRSELKGSVVVKHHDASMIGLPDCSITWAKKIVWLEFKLYVPGVRHQKTPAELAAESPTQHAMMCRLGLQAHAAWYVIWWKKSKKILVWDPLSNEVLFEAKTTPELVDWITGWLCAH
jgi:hypothetical protein